MKLSPLILLLILSTMLCSSCTLHLQPLDSSINAEGPVGNAGCMIVRNNKVLLLRHVPDGRIGFPGGTNERGETARQTAHRETWEEVGRKVTVKNLLLRFSNGFYLFQCDPIETTSPSEVRLPVMPWSRTEVLAIEWMDPFSIETAQWRFPDQVPEIQTLLESFFRGKGRT